MLLRYVPCVSLFLLASCALDRESGAHLRSVSRTSDLAMSADYRMVYKRDRADRKVFCAEPSPDIGRIVSAASNASVTGSAKGLARVQPELALAFAASRAEGLAQLGQRLATIQLLRDSTFRACEAYANEAISASTYAMIVSRYDDVMVTLLLGEMAANTARPASSALLTGAASTNGLSQTTSEAAVKLAIARAEKATSNLDAAVSERGKLKTDAAEAEKTSKQQAVVAAQKEFDEASSLLKVALSAVGGTMVSTSPAVAEGQPPAAATVVAQQLATMQKVYLNDFNLDAVTVGCLSALSQLDWPSPTAAGTATVSNKVARPNAIIASRSGDVIGDPGPVGSLSAIPSVPQGPGVQGTAGGKLTFLSTEAGGAYTLQDECRALLLSGQTLRAAANGRLQQIAAEAAKGK